jgi:hypothetical protein
MLESEQACDLTISDLMVEVAALDPGVFEH